MDQGRAKGPDDPERRRWPEIDVSGLVVLILALAVGVSLVLAVIDVTLRGFQVSPEGLDLASTVFGASIGVVATFVGLRGRGRSDD
jgi:hypothetical protein